MKADLAICDKFWIVHECNFHIYTDKKWILCWHKWSVFLDPVTISGAYRKFVLMTSDNWGEP